MNEFQNMNNLSPKVWTTRREYNPMCENFSSPNVEYDVAKFAMSSKYVELSESCTGMFLRGVRKPRGRWSPLHHHFAHPLSRGMGTKCRRR